MRRPIDITAAETTSASDRERFAAMTEDPQKQLREEDTATPPLPPLSLPADTGDHSPLAKDEDEPHPLLIALVQAMARNAARKDYAASQRGEDD